MERTKKRATVTGDIKSKHVRNYGLILMALGLITLAALTTLTAMYVALFGIFMYVLIYGVAKRKTIYSTMIGSISGAIPPVVGYSAFSSSVDQGAMLLFFILVCWQMAHFYGIALYRKKEYKAAGLKVWPLVKGDWSTQVQAMFFIAFYTIFAMAMFILGYTGFIYLVVIMITGLGWLWYSVTLASRYNASEWGRKVFHSSLTVIIVTSIALSLGPLLP
jgi:protoheme IX farnesyltransferase